MTRYSDGGYAWCGYCCKCEEFKDDDYGCWYIEKDDNFNDKVKTARGCRDCGQQILTMEQIEGFLPGLYRAVSKLFPEMLEDKS